MPPLSISCNRQSSIVLWVKWKYKQLLLHPTLLAETDTQQFSPTNSVWSPRLFVLILESLTKSSQKTSTSSTPLIDFLEIRKISKISPFDSTKYSLKCLVETEGIALFVPKEVIFRWESSSYITARVPCKVKAYNFPLQPIALVNCIKCFCALPGACGSMREQSCFIHSYSPPF